MPLSNSYVRSLMWPLEMCCLGWTFPVSNVESLLLQVHSLCLYGAIRAVPDHVSACDSAGVAVVLPAAVAIETWLTSKRGSAPAALVDRRGVNGIWLFIFMLFIVLRRFI